MQKKIKKNCEMSVGNRTGEITNGKGDKTGSERGLKMKTRVRDEGFFDEDDDATR